MFNKVMKVFLVDEGAEGTPQQQSKSAELAELDALVAMSSARSASRPVVPDDSRMIAGPTRQSQSFPVASVESAKEALAQAAYAANSALAAFKTNYDALSMLPPDMRLQAAVATTVKVGCFTRDQVLKAMGEALNALENHAKDFVASTNDQERQEIQGRASRRDQIDSELARLRQQQEKLEDEKSGVIAEIEEHTRKFSQIRATYDVASKNAVDEVVALRNALAKIN